MVGREPMSTLKVNRIEPRTGDSVEIVGLGDVGKVLQYDFMFQSTEITTSSNDWMDTGFELNFTPKTDTGRLRITACLKVDGYQANSVRSGKTNFRIWRHDSTVTQIERGYYRNMSVSNENRGLTGWLDFNYVDRPGTTATINYKIQFQNMDDSSQVFSGSQIGMFEIMEIAV